MKVSELGQFGLIDVIAKMIEETRDNRVPSWRNLRAGVGDDCAVWKGDSGYQLAKVDCQVQGIHFNLDIVSWEDLGWKSLAVNLSDIASMGGIPHYALVSLGLPQDTEVEGVVSLYRGLLKLAVLTGTAVVGGNVSRSPVIFIDVSLFGSASNPEGMYLARSVALPGDRIAVTGWLGTAAAGLDMLTRKLALKKTAADCLKQAFTRPEPRLAEGRLLIDCGVRAGMDISDGLLSDLGHICRSSSVGAIVRADHLPVHPEVIKAFPQKYLEMALSGGEDYQLLFTAPSALIDRVQQASSCPITIIGEITAENPGQIIVLDEAGRRLQPEKTGWDHFKL